MNDALRDAFAYFNLNFPKIQKETGYVTAPLEKDEVRRKLKYISDAYRVRGGVEVLTGLKEILTIHNVWHDRTKIITDSKKYIETAIEKFEIGLKLNVPSLNKDNINAPAVISDSEGSKLEKRKGRLLVTIIKIVAAVAASLLTIIELLERLKR